MKPYLCQPNAFAKLKRNIRMLAVLPKFLAGKSLEIRAKQKQGRRARSANPFEKFFYRRKKGPGIWKWTHYFPIYERHLLPLAQTKPALLEIGIFSGGSLDMWKSVMGPGTRVAGLDIHPACLAYKKNGFEIFVGDQSRAGVWRRIFGRMRRLDIVIDDGSHLPRDQIATFEAVFPCLEPGGVMIFEDVHGEGNLFAAYCRGLATQLNHVNPLDGTFETLRSNSVQQYVRSISFYPFVVVIERNLRPKRRLVSLKNGTQWAPFFDPYFKTKAHPQRTSLSFQRSKKAKSGSS